MAMPSKRRSVPACFLVLRVWIPVKKWVLISRVCCVDSSLCDGLITHSEESYRVYVCLIVCDLQTSTMRRHVLELDCSATHRQNWKISLGQSCFQLGSSCCLVLVYDLLNDTFSTANDVSWLGNDVEERDQGITWGTTSVFSWKDWRQS